MAAPSAAELRREFLLDPEAMIAQMAAVRLPAARQTCPSNGSRATDSRSGRRCADDLLRLSVAAYTTREDIDSL